MTGWKRAFLVSLALGLLITVACSRGVPQADYDKARADLAAAQGQAKELETQLGSVKANLDKANADLAQAKSDSDKAKADLATAQARVQSLQNDYTSAVAERDKARNDLVQVRADSDKARADLQAALARVQRLERELALAQGGQELPGSLATLQAYAKVTDLLFLDLYRQQLGLEPKYQYAEPELRAEAAKAVEASNDPVLKAIWTMGVSEGPLESFGAFMALYQAIALNSILSGEGTPAVFPPAPMAGSASPAGQTLLRVKLVATDGKPVPK